MKNILAVKKVAGAIVAGLLVAGLAGCGGSSAAAPADGGAKEITVAVAPGFFPITYADDNGVAQGYDVEVFKAIDEILPEYTFKFEIADKETMNVGVQAGTYQVGINSLFKTQARQETYFLPENNMGYTPVGIIQREDDNITDLTVAHDDGRKSYPVNPAGGIGFVITNWNEAHPDKQIEYDLITEFSYADIFDSIKAGDYDFEVDLIPVFNLQKPEAVAGLKITDPIDVIPTYPIVNKDQQELGKAIDDALLKLKNDGTLSKLSTEVFGQDLFELAK